VSVSPADFELYSRATGAPLPRTAQEQMQMAPQVHQFIQSRGYQRPKGFLGEVGGYLKNAALLGGGLALANYLSSNNDDSDDGIRVDLASPGSVDASVVPQRMITGATNVIGTQPSPAPTPTPQTPVVRENVGTLGSITRPLGVQVSDPWGMDKGTTEVVTPSRGFGPAPAPRAEAEGLRDIEFSMKPPIQRDPSFFNPTGSWGVGDTANLAGSAINFAGQYGPTIIDQGALDIGKGVRDIQKGIDDTSVVINSVYDAGAASRKFLDSTIASLPTSSFQQSAPLETDGQSILIDHPDVVQSGTGSDEVQSNRNYIAQGNVDLEGKPITVGEFDSAYPAETYTDYRKFGVGGGGVNYLDAGNRYGGDPERVGKVPSQRVKDEFISSAGIPQIEEELVGGSVEQPSTGGNFLSNFVDKAKAAWDENTRLANELGREQDLVQDARDHYSEEGAMTVRPEDSKSVTGFTMSPEMVFETQYKKTPDKRYGTDLSVRNTYSVDPSEVSEVANPDTFKEIERAAWKQQAERGEEVVDMMNEVAKTDEGAGFLANFLSKDKEKRFIDAPREETY
jgi:hypothetical protein